MTYLELVNRLRQNCGVTGADLTTVIGQIGEPQRLCNWINEAWLDIQTQHEDWGWMNLPVAFPTFTGRPIYSLAQIGIDSTFGYWDRDSFRNYANPVATVTIASPGVFSLQSHGLSVGDTVTPFTTGALPTGLSANVAVYVQSVLSADTFTVSATSGGSAINTTGTQSGEMTLTSNNTLLFAGLQSEVFMDYQEYDAWRDCYQFGALRSITTRPVTVTITPEKSIGLGPFPISGYTVVGEYYTVPTELTVSTDVPAMPEKFHLAIVYKAMIAYGQYEAAPEVIARGESEYRRWMARILNDRMVEITTCGALA